MKMTRKEVAELLLNMNDDCSRLEYKVYGSVLWSDWTENDIGKILYHISKSGYTFRIKDNSLKEVTTALRGKWARRISTNPELSTTGDELPINGLNIIKQRLYLNGYWHDLKEFNEQWQLVED